jgi:hypothetical protein
MPRASSAQCGNRSERNAGAGQETKLDQQRADLVLFRRRYGHASRF